MNKCYRAFGQTISTDLDFSDMLCRADRTPGIEILSGKVADEQVWEKSKVFRKGLQAEISLRGGLCKMYWPSLMRCQIDLQNKITYVHLGHDVQTLKLFLLSEIIGFSLLQKGLFLLHGSAVLVQGKAHVFVGDPGAGKSTTAAAFWQAGHTILTDDLVALDFGQDQISVLPGFPQFKIWKNAVIGLGIDESILRPSFEGQEKYLISQDFESFPEQAIPLASIHVLNSAESTEINPLAASTELLKHFPLPHQTLEGNYLKEHFEYSTVLAERGLLYFLKRPSDFEKLIRFPNEFTAQ